MNKNLNSIIEINARIYMNFFLLFYFYFICVLNNNWESYIPASIVLYIRTKIQDHIISILYRLYTTYSTEEYIYLCGGLLSTLTYELEIYYCFNSVIWIHAIFLLLHLVVDLVVYIFITVELMRIHICIMVNCVDEEGNLSGAVMTLLCHYYCRLWVDYNFREVKNFMRWLSHIHTYGMMLFMDFNRFFMRIYMVLWMHVLFDIVIKLA